MILGVLSDSHGNSARTAQAVALLRRLGAAALVHCGDVGGDAVLDELSGGPAWFVWGNTDHADPFAEQYARSLGLHPPIATPTAIELHGKRIHVYHGHEPAFERAVRRAQSAAVSAAAAADPHYVLFGHTHVAADDTFGPTRHVNPGALHRARTYTVATIDLAADLVEHWVVDDARDAGRPRRFRLTGA